MKKFLCVFSLLIAITVTAFAQTQQGVVKTRGRMVNGRHVRGQGLPGATVAIRGGNNQLVRNANGSFSFPVPSKTYLVREVKKSGYQLIDADATTKPHTYSTDTLYLVMETPEQLLDDQLDAQERISKTLREQLKKARTEIQRLKDENKISEEEYRQRIAKLMQDQQNNQQLIADMAKEYAHIDYDLLDALNRRISDAILNGD